MRGVDRVRLDDVEKGLLDGVQRPVNEEGGGLVEPLLYSIQVFCLSAWAPHKELRAWSIMTCRKLVTACTETGLPATV